MSNYQMAYNMERNIDSKAKIIIGVLVVVVIVLIIVLATSSCDENYPIVRCDSNTDCSGVVISDGKDYTLAQCTPQSYIASLYPCGAEDR